MIDILTVILVLGGVFFLFVGALGLIRLPDAMTRAHGAAKCDTLGAILVLAGLVLQTGMHLASAKLILVIVFLWMTNPTATHAIAKAILRKSKMKTYRD